jgi:hypothetical protein
VPNLKEFILSKDKSGGNCLNGAFQWDEIRLLNKCRMDEEGGYMRRNKTVL